MFDHGYAGDTYSLEDLITIYGATTANKAPSSTFEDWTDSCKIDTIIYERESANLKLFNVTESLQNQILQTPNN